MIKSTLFLLFLLLIACSPSKQAGTISDVDYEIGMSGVVASQDSTPVKDAPVCLYTTGSGLDTGKAIPVDTTFSDSTGSYYFDVNSAGLYQVRSFSGDTLSGIRRNIVYENSHVEIDPLYLERNGAISGVVTLRNADTHRGILVYIPGTSYSAFSDSTGRYTISGIAPENHYNLVFSMYGYESLMLFNISVLPGKTVTKQAIELVPNLYPQNVKIMSQTNPRVVSISWDSLHREDIIGYNIYRGDSLLTAPDPERVNGDNLVVGTSFIDTVEEELFSWEDTITFYYQIRGKDIRGETPFSDKVFRRIGIERDPASQRTIQVMAPTMKDTVHGVRYINFKWNYTGVIDSVGIDLSLDNGSSWGTIVHSTPNKGEYSWLAALEMNADSCKIRIRDIADSLVQDWSDPFVIRKGREELLENGSFSLWPQSSWDLKKPHPNLGYGKWEIDSGAARVEVTEVIPEPAPERSYYVRLMQEGVTIVKGREYELSFRHRSSQERYVSATVFRNSEPWETAPHLDSENFYWSTREWQSDTLRFRGAFDDSIAAVAINCAAALGTVWIDDVSLKMISGE